MQELENIEFKPVTNIPNYNSNLAIKSVFNSGFTVIAIDFKNAYLLNSSPQQTQESLNTQLSLFSSTPSKVLISIIQSLLDPTKNCISSINCEFHKMFITCETRIGAAPLKYIFELELQTPSFFYDQYLKYNTRIVLEFAKRYKESLKVIENLHNRLNDAILIVDHSFPKEAANLKRNLDDFSVFNLESRFDLEMKDQHLNLNLFSNEEYRKLYKISIEKKDIELKQEIINETFEDTPVFEEKEDEEQELELEREEREELERREKMRLEDELRSKKIKKKRLI